MLFFVGLNRGSTRSEFVIGPRPIYCVTDRHDARNEKTDDRHEDDTAHEHVRPTQPIPSHEAPSLSDRDPRRGDLIILGVNPKSVAWTKCSSEYDRREVHGNPPNRAVRQRDWKVAFFE